MNVDNRPFAEEFAKQRAKLRKLGRVVRELLRDHPADTQRVLGSCGIDDLETFLSSSEASDIEAFWDEDDRVYRCPECKWELQHGECVTCGLEFEMDLKDDADYTVNEALNPDRLPKPRGDTPLRDDEQQFLPPPAYMNRQIEYEALRERGATRLMCETFNLEFDEATGIVAWADGDIYHEFSGPLMQKGDFWKIMLGRRIQLDEDDLDGSLLLEALLEDTMIFPSASDPEWETVEESPGIWVTRPVDPDSGSESGSEPLDPHTEADNKLEPGYVPPALPVQAHGYETSDAECDEDVDMAVDIKREEEDEELGVGGAAEDSDPGWTYEANVPDSAWSTGVIPLDTNEEMEADVEEEDAADNEDSDSADSDFDSDEVLSGDEGILAAGQQFFIHT